MNLGYVKLWRKSMEGGWLSNHKLWAFWCWCLMKASYKECDIIVEFRRVHLMPGDFVFGRKKASKELKMSEQSIRTCLNFLKTCQNLTTKTTNRFSIVSIVNWDTYQTEENESNQQINQQATSSQPASNHKQEIKEIKELKEIKYSPDFLKFYQAYPKKKKRDDAWKAWKKVNRPDIATILKAIDEQIKNEDWKKENGKYIPYPATWLNAGQWADEPEVKKTEIAKHKVLKAWELPDPDKEWEIITQRREAKDDG